MLSEIRGQLKVISERAAHIGEQLKQEHAGDLSALTLARLLIFLATVQDKLATHDAAIARELIECDRPLYRRAEQADATGTTEQGQGKAGGKPNGRKSGKGK